MRESLVEESRVLARRQTGVLLVRVERRQILVAQVFVSVDGAVFGGRIQRIGALSGGKVVVGGRVVVGLVQCPRVVARSNGLLFGALLRPVNEVVAADVESLIVARLVDPSALGGARVVELGRVNFRVLAVARGRRIVEAPVVFFARREVVVRADRCFGSVRTVSVERRQRIEVIAVALALRFLATARAHDA